MRGCGYEQTLLLFRIDQGQYSLIGEQGFNLLNKLGQPPVSTAVGQ
jgi:hypothetical protein